MFNKIRSIHALLILQSIFHSHIIELFYFYVAGHAHITDFNIATVLSGGQLATSMSGTKPYIGNIFFIILVIKNFTITYRKTSLGSGN